MKKVELNPDNKLNLEALIQTKTIHSKKDGKYNDSRLETFFDPKYPDKFITYEYKLKNNMIEPHNTHNTLGKR